MTRNSLDSHFEELISNHKPSDFEIIGFDLGHGKTALASIKANAKTAPENIEIDGKDFQMTAYAKDKITNVITIGEQAYDSLEYDDEKVSDFEIGFKDIPSENNKRKIKIFVKAVYDRVKDKLHQDLKPLFFIGRPSGWREEDGQEYCQLFIQAGIPNGIDVAESRAALMRARDSGALTISQLKKPILVIDIGSSTTDFTLVDGEKAEDYGQSDYHLGASLIDKAILQYSLDHDNDQNKDSIKQIFDKFPKKEKRCEITSRKLKEIYFSNYKTKFRDKPQRYISFEGMSPRAKIDTDIEFIWKINATIMSEILDQPLETLDNKSWKRAFEEELRIVKQKFDDKKINPTAIYISGGAYRMYFVREICEDIFCKDKNTTIIPANKPELDVSRGLASWGKHYVATAKFRLEVKQFEGKKLERIIENRIPKLIDSLADLLKNDLIDEVIQPCLIDWQQRRIESLNQLEARIEQEARKWLKSDTINQQVNEQVTKWGVKVLQEVGEEINNIGTKYHLPEGTLGFAVDGSILNNSHRGINISVPLPQVLDDIIFPVTMAIMAAIVAMIDLIIEAVAWGICGPIIGAIVGIAIAIVGKELAEDVDRDLDITQWMRSLILLRDIYIDNLIEKQ
ncbi:MAG: Hsp70 family protein [Xenococcus sp. (in: cyanobacteria)]